jgi:hypothetical protein
LLNHLWFIISASAYGCTLGKSAIEQYVAIFKSLRLLHNKTQLTCVQPDMKLIIIIQQRKKKRQLTKITVSFQLIIQEWLHKQKNFLIALIGCNNLRFLLPKEQRFTDQIIQTYAL